MDWLVVLQGYTIGIILITTCVVLGAMGFLTRKNHFPIEGRTALITGGSSGLGLALGMLLAQKGGNVIIVARDVEKLKAAMEDIKAAAENPLRQRFHYLSADLTDPAASVRVLEEATRWNQGLPPDICWSNAGASIPMLFVDAPPELLRSQMETNYLSCAWFCQAALKAWLKPLDTDAAAKGGASREVWERKGAGLAPRHLVLTSSSAAFCGVAGYATYAPTKAAMRSLCDCLRSEVNLYNGARRRAALNTPFSAGRDGLPPADIKVASLYPGNILTPGYDAEERTKHPVTRILEEGDPRQTAAQVAEKAVRRLERGGYLVTTQYLAELMRVSALQGSPRNGRVWDTLGAWVTSVAWLFIGPDLEGKVWGYGKRVGLGREKEEGKKEGGEKR